MFEHPQYGGEVETICTDLTKRGPALGILLRLATQRPDAKSIPTGISANAVLRMCLKVMGQTENDMVLGTSAYKNGIRATMFGFDDKGVFYFAGEGKAPQIVYGYGFDLPASKVIVARARVMREHAGRITGYALGEDHDGGQARRLLDDVLTVFGDAKALWCSDDRRAARRIASPRPTPTSPRTPSRASCARSGSTCAASGRPAAPATGPAPAATGPSSSGSPEAGDA